MLGRAQDKQAVQAGNWMEKWARVWSLHKTALKNRLGARIGKLGMLGIQGIERICLAWAWLNNKTQGMWVRN